MLVLFTSPCAGKAPRVLVKVPLTLKPTVLVPTVLLAELIASRRLHCPPVPQVEFLSAVCVTVNVACGASTMLPASGCALLKTNRSRDALIFCGIATTVSGEPSTSKVTGTRGFQGSGTVLVSTQMCTCWL